MSLNGSINLMKYPGARRILANGVKGIFIPVDENPSIYVGDKGAYATIRVVEKESEFNDKHYTHFVAASLPKKVRDALKEKGKTDEELKALAPILGNLETYDPQAGGGSAEYEQASVEEAAEDLPF